MSDFEGLFGLLGLMFGLIVAELALKFADAIDARRERPIGILTPALAFLLLTDVTSIWINIWAVRTALVVNWHTVFGVVLLAIVYLLAAALVFPRTRGGAAHLDDHYWLRKRLVASAILLANIALDGFMLTRALPTWNDWWFYFYFVGYLLPVAGLVVSRSKRLDLFFLTCAIALNLISGSDLTPPSQWGARVGLSFSVQQPVTAPH